jgi:hypothetical protein
MSKNPYEPGSAPPITTHELLPPSKGRRIGALVLLVLGGLAAFYAIVATYIVFFAMEGPAEQRRPAQHFAIAMAGVAVALFWSATRLRRGKSLRLVGKHLSPPE